MKPKSYHRGVTDRRMHSTRTLLLLAALVLGLFLVTGPLANAANIPFVFASTEEGGDSGGDEGGSDESSDEGNNDEGNEEEEGRGGEGSYEVPETEPEPATPEPEPEPAQPQVCPPLCGEGQPVPETPPALFQCPNGAFVKNENNCPEPNEIFPNPPVGCENLTPLECLGEKLGVPPPECEGLSPLECLEQELNKPPLESPSPKPLPYCDKVPDNYQGACHDRKDIDEITGLYPCNDGTQEEDWRDCLDATEPGDSYCQALGCPGSPPDPINGCMDGRDPVNGKCPYPKPLEPEPECPPGWKYREMQDDCYKEVTIIINKIIKETNEGKHNDGFPDVDIIGLSVKQDGDAMICAMDIDNSWVQCQEFGMDPQRVIQAFWRIIETDSDKNYDNGNTGSNNVDLAIEDIKNHDFDELDDDRDNHDFGIDLAFVAINPQGEGVTCLTDDQSGEGDSLCEPFKVSAQDVDGQITEGVEFN